MDVVCGYLSGGCCGGSGCNWKQWLLGGASQAAPDPCTLHVLQVGVNRVLAGAQLLPDVLEVGQNDALVHLLNLLYFWA
jgi:hypothetical protein